MLLNTAIESLTSARGKKGKKRKEKKRKEKEKDHFLLLNKPEFFLSVQESLDGACITVHGKNRGRMKELAATF